GRYPASSVFREPGISSGLRDPLARNCLRLLFLLQINLNHGLGIKIIEKVIESSHPVTSPIDSTPCSTRVGCPNH
ncbi:MAG: hypothetical protein ACKO4R_05400, partial [Synechococcales cyanobacterium]